MEGEQNDSSGNCWNFQYISVHTTVSLSKTMHFYIIIIVLVALTNFTAFFKDGIEPEAAAAAQNDEKNNEGSYA